MIVDKLLDINYQRGWVKRTILPVLILNSLFAKSFKCKTTSSIMVKFLITPHILKKRLTFLGKSEWSIGFSILFCLSCFAFFKKPLDRTKGILCYTEKSVDTCKVECAK